VCWKAVQNAVAVKSLESVDRTQQSATVHYVRPVTTRTSLHRTSVNSASQDHIQGCQHTLFLSRFILFSYCLSYTVRRLCSRKTFVCFPVCLSLCYNVAPPGEWQQLSFSFLKFMQIDCLLTFLNFNFVSQKFWLFYFNFFDICLICAHHPAVQHRALVTSQCCTDICWGLNDNTDDERILSILLCVCL